MRSTKTLTAILSRQREEREMWWHYKQRMVAGPYPGEVRDLMYHHKALDNRMQRIVERIFASWPK